MLATAPLLGSLRLFPEAGIEAIRAKSLAQTGYLIDLLEATGLLRPAFGFRLGTPRDAARRGGHVAVEHEGGPRIARALKARGVVPDFRPPDVVRLAPIPLYTSYLDLWRLVAHLREVVETGAYLEVEAGREAVA